MKLRFNWLSGDFNWLDYGGKWISQELNNGDWPYWIVLDFTNMDDACGRDNEGKPKYYVSISAVSPKAAGDNLKAAYDSCGWTGEEEFLKSPVAQVEALHSYGTYAVLWQGQGDNAHKLIKEAKKQAMQAEFLFGFAMDRQQNAIGSTGWDFIKGDILGGLHKQA